MRYTKNNPKDFERHQSEGKKCFACSHSPRRRAERGKVYHPSSLFHRRVSRQPCAMFCYRHIKWKRSEAVSEIFVKFDCVAELHHNQNLIERKPFVSKYSFCRLIFLSRCRVSSDSCCSSSTGN